MANHVYKDTARIMGYCCEYSLTLAFRGIPATVVGPHLGMNDSSVRWWRRKVADSGHPPCERCPELFPVDEFVTDWLRSRDQ